MALVRILIVDDYDLWKSFVKARLRERADFEIVGFAADGLQAVQKAEELQPDIILLDMMLPEQNGIQAAQQIRSVAPQSKIIFLSSESDAESVQSAFQAGGSGYILKIDATEGLLEGIESVLRGERFVSPSLTDSGNVADSEIPGSEDEDTAT